ncbi:MAG: membrane protein insertion efficiency factor YidD [Brevibacterium yomogidense]|uniref:Putative membrane protein insertion efficiency factor n=1 Tax=Brevibacterium yomogidense TaxID=946573 RepID=A0A1X6WXI3_9MICO|nr:MULTISPECIES: membrane protein insertion efficiency factor YidD [Brevibacterium]SLM90565.1 Protein YidD [Brevibacterium yomogidense]SMX82498.1 putative membrane protein insertion efficiency factor [Brevibacterium sp. Mu109]
MRSGEDTESSLPDPPAGRAARFGHVLRIAPRMPFVWFMRAYRVVISPLYGDVCRYYPSCSKYALDAFEVKGAVAGMFMAAWRVLRCNPFTRGGVDHVKGSVLERRSAEIWGQDGPANNGRMYNR